MDQKKRRGENWSAEEKDVLRQLIGESAHIIENKCTKTNSNILKAKEWKNILNKFIEITGKSRTDSEIKLAWKRMKLSAKANLSTHRQQQFRTGGGEKPPSPSQEEQEIMAIAPHDFVIEENNYDSDAIQIYHSQPTEDAIAGPSCQTISPTPNIIIADIHTSEHIVEKVTSQEPKNDPKKEQKKEPEKSIKKRNKNIRGSIIESNIEFKKRNLEMLEIEHTYNIEIAKLKIKKLKLEIELLEHRKNSSQE